MFLVRQRCPRRLSKLAVTLIAAITVVPATADAQPSPVNPYTYTCADLLAAAAQDTGQDDRVLANLMVLWTTGYLYGRLESIEGSNFTEENFDQIRDDTVAALTGICPNVPDLAIASFAANLAGDVERSLGVE